MIRWLKTRRFARLQAVSPTRRGTRARSGRGRNRNQLSHPHQVVRCGRKDENLSHLEQSAMFQFAQQRDDLPPTETSLDALLPFLADVVAGTTGAVRINGTAAWRSRVLRHVQRHIHVAALVDEFRRAESLVAAGSYPQQPFRRNLWSRTFHINRVRLRRHLVQNLVGHRAQRTTLPLPLFRRQVTVQITLLIINSPHDFVLTAHCVGLKQLFQCPDSVVSVEG